MDITLSVKQKDVFAEVEQKTNYIGAKMVGDDTAYERIGTIDDDQPELSQLFDECSVELAFRMVSYLIDEGIEEDEKGEKYYRISLDVPDSFNESLIHPMNHALFNYFVYGILSSWFAITNKQEAELYAAQSEAMLDNLFKRIIKRTFTRKQRPF